MTAMDSLALCVVAKLDHSIHCKIT